jgi:hypothetical protein
MYLYDNIVTPFTKIQQQFVGVVQNTYVTLIHVVEPYWHIFYLSLPVSRAYRCLKEKRARGCVTRHLAKFISGLKIVKIPMLYI